MEFMKWMKSLKPGWSLRTALVVYVVVPVAIVLMVGGAMGLWALEKQMESRLQEDVELVARSIQPALSRALEQERSGSINQTLQAAFSIDRVFGVYLYDTRGGTVATAGQEGALPSGQVSQLALEGERKGEYGRLAGRDVYSYFVPLTDSGARIIGLLQVTRRASDFEEYIGSLRLQMLFLSLLIGGLVTGLVLFGHQGAIGRHLRKIINSMHEVRSGNLRHRSVIDGPAEIVHLGTSLNDMLDSIQLAEERIEKHREAEMELSRKLRRSERMAAMGQLAGGVAHELGTPLSVISGNAQRLKRNKYPDEVIRGLSQISGQVHRMEKIIHQLLDFGRGHQIQLRRMHVDLLVQSALAALETDNQDFQGPVEIEGTQPSPCLEVDPFRFEQVLTNLLQNAIHASEGGRVKLSWLTENHELHLEVEDDGPGIPEDIRPRLFEPFFTTKKSGEGTGLGLALVQRVIEEHKGRMEVEDSPMGGALFRIILPLPDEMRDSADPNNQCTEKDH